MSKPPMACMSGVTGSDLKRRIVRIMTEQVARQLDFSRKLLLSLAGIAAIALPIVFGLVHISQVRAQSSPRIRHRTSRTPGRARSTPAETCESCIKISKADGGGYKALSYSIDQSGDPIPVTKITLEGTTVKMSLTMIGGTYEGKLSADGKTITGTWTQGPPSTSEPDARHARNGMDHPAATAQAAADGRECQSQLRGRHHQAE